MSAGVDGVIVCDPVTDLFNPNVVRASTGVLFSVPIVVADNAAVLAPATAQRLGVTNEDVVSVAASDRAADVSWRPSTDNVGVAGVQFRLDGGALAASKQVECEIRMSTAALPLLPKAAACCPFYR